MDCGRLMKVVRLIEVKQKTYTIFIGTLITGHLIGCGRVIAGRVIGVRLYLKVRQTQQLAANPVGNWKSLDNHCGFAIFLFLGC